MKIGFVLDDHMHRPGGIQEHIRGLYKYLTSHGHEAVIFTGGGQFENNFEERVLQIGTSVAFKGSGSWTSVPITLRPPWELRRLLRKEACDVLDIQAPFSPTLSGRLLANSDAAHLMTFLISIDGRLRQTLARTAALAQIPSLRRFHHRIAVSGTAEASGRNLYGGTYDVIPDAVDIAPFAAAAAERAPRQPGDPLTLLFIGRLEERKGAAHLLRAYARVEREHGTAVRLVLAGKGPEGPALEQLARELGLRQVEFLGYVAREELPRLLANADIFCAPAVGNESFGRVLVEAMAAGLPIVAFGNAGYAETLSHHPGNLVVRPRDERAFAAGLATFVASDRLRERVSASNRAGVVRYTWDTVGPQYIAACERAIAARGRR